MAAWWAMAWMEAALRAADHRCGGFDLGGDGVLCADAAGEEVFYGEDLLVYFARLCECVLEIVDILPGQDVFEGKCPVVEEVRAIVEDGRGADLGKRTMTMEELGAWSMVRVCCCRPETMVWGRVWLWRDAAPDWRRTRVRVVSGKAPSYASDLSWG